MPNHNQLTDSQRHLLEDLKARQRTGERMPCPRCGRDTMDSEPLHNALSRHADVYVCNACGMDEALLACKGNPKPMSEWACFADSKESALLPTSELISRIMTEHIHFLCSLYERWLNESEYEDFKEYQAAAKNRYPGLIELRSDPFIAVYQAKDGKIAVRFETDAEGIKVTAGATR